MPSGAEWFIVLAVVLVVFGGSQLPKLAKNLGKAQKEFKDGLAEGQADDAERDVAAARDAAAAREAAAVRELAAAREAAARVSGVTDSPAPSAPVEPKLD